MMDRFFFRFFETPIGRLKAVSDGACIIRLDLHTENRERASFTESAQPFKELSFWLNTYFSGKDPGSPPALSPCGTEFQRRVWGEISKIPFGHVKTYGTVAKAIRSNLSPQAVGSAIGKNPLLLLIPCHRVIAAGNQIGGFSAGVEKKVILLENEGYSPKEWKNAIYRS